jgi:hypothetical protein
VAQAEKEKANQNKAYTEAVRSHQRQEEILGFQRIPVQQGLSYNLCCHWHILIMIMKIMPVQNLRMNMMHHHPHLLQLYFFHLRQFDRPLTLSMFLQFSSISMPPVIKTTVHNGRTLVHRVEKENIPVHVPTQVMCFTLSMTISRLWPDLQSLDHTNIPMSRPNKNLVRRVLGNASQESQPPQMMEFHDNHGTCAWLSCQ